MDPEKNKNVFAVPTDKKRMSKRKMLAVLGLFGFVLLIGMNVPAEIATDGLKAMPLRADMVGFAYLACAYLLGILLMAPLSPFALAAGGLFGFWWGTVLALLTLNVGAMLAFCIARYFLPRPLGERLRGNGRVNIMATAITGRGISSIAMLRLNPMIPFNVQNYVCGATGVNFARYSLGTFLGAAPCTIALVYLGHAGRRLVVDTGLQLEEWSLLIFLSAAVLTIPLTFTVLRDTVQRLRESRNNGEATINRETVNTKRASGDSSDRECPNREYANREYANREYTNRECSNSRERHCRKGAAVKEGIGRE